MKRLTLLALTSVMAVTLSACGDKAEKKVETQAASQEHASLNQAAQDVDHSLSADKNTDAAQPVEESAQAQDNQNTQDDSSPAPSDSAQGSSEDKSTEVPASDENPAAPAE